jgi:hypothetical protein
METITDAAIEASASARQCGALSSEELEEHGSNVFEHRGIDGIDALLRPLFRTHELRFLQDLEVMRQCALGHVEHLRQLTSGHGLTLELLQNLTPAGIIQRFEHELCAHRSSRSVARARRVPWRR